MAAGRISWLVFCSLCITHTSIGRGPPGAAAMDTTRGRLTIDGPFLPANYEGLPGYPVLQTGIPILPEIYSTVAADAEAAAGQSPLLPPFETGFEPGRELTVVVPQNPAPRPQEVGVSRTVLEHQPSQQSQVDPWLPMPADTNQIISVATECDTNQNMMRVTFEFERAFDGFVYSKGFFNSDRCKQRGTGQRTVTLIMPLDGNCGVERSGTEGSNLQYSNTIVVMNEAEWALLEMMDSAFKVHCGFTPDSVQTLSNGITVPMIDYTDLPISATQTPDCRMKITPGKDPLGQRVNRLNLGDIGSMVFYMMTPDGGPSVAFDLFIFDCFASDGTSRARVQLLDNNGCPVQRKIIGQPVNSRGDIREGETLVYAHFKVFKFPDVNNVYFECQCRVCVDDCNAPLCDGISGRVAGRRKRQTPARYALERSADEETGLTVGRGARVGALRAGTNTTAGQSPGLDALEVLEALEEVNRIAHVVETIEVDIPDNLASTQAEREPLVEEDDYLEISRTNFIVAMTVMASLMVASMMSTLVMCVRRRKYA